MTGRNNKPDNDGPASAPDRLDQFGDKLADNSGRIPKKRSRGNKVLLTTRGPYSQRERAAF